VPLLIIVLLLALCAQNITIDSKAFAQLPVPKVESNPSRIITSSVATNNNVTMTIHTTNSIQGNNFNVIKQVEPAASKVKKGAAKSSKQRRFRINRDEQNSE
jgi:hypothetical protein